MSRELNKIYNFKDKAYNVENYVQLMENKLQTVFIWENLPDTIEQRWLEQILQRTGSITFLELKDSDIHQYDDSREMPAGIYALQGNIGGVQDFNGNGTFSIVAHPRLYSSLQRKIDEECVVCYNDSNKRGLWDLHLKWATMLAENDLSIELADIATRAMVVATVGTDAEKLAFENYIQKLTDGNISAIIGNVVMDSIKLQDYATVAHQMITNLIELEQYLSASWSREFGMNNQFNMKREAIMSGEAEIGEDSIMTLLQDMLNERKKACEKINAMFGLNVSVHFSNIFENNLAEDEVTDEEVQEEEVAENDELGDENTSTVEDNNINTEDNTSTDNNPTDDNRVESSEEQVTEETEEATEEVQEEQADVVVEINIDQAEEVVTEEATEENKEEEEEDEDEVEGQDNE